MADHYFNTEPPTTQSNSIVSSYSRCKEKSKDRKRKASIIQQNECSKIRKSASLHTITFTSDDDDFNNDDNNNEKSDCYREIGGHKSHADILGSISSLKSCTIKVKSPDYIEKDITPVVIDRNPEIQISLTHLSKRKICEDVKGAKKKQKIQLDVANVSLNGSKKELFSINNLDEGYEDDLGRLNSRLEGGQKIRKHLMKNMHKISELSLDTNSFVSSPQLMMTGKIRRKKPNYKKKLVRFYKKHNPLKLSKVNGLLRKYVGKENELFEKLIDKYNIPVNDVTNTTDSTSVPSVSYFSVEVDKSSTHYSSVISSLPLDERRQTKVEEKRRDRSNSCNNTSLEGRRDAFIRTVSVSKMLSFISARR